MQAGLLRRAPARAVDLRGSATTRQSSSWRHEIFNTTAELERDFADCIRLLAEHRRNARKTLWCRQRTGWQIHVFGRTGDLDRYKGDGV